MRMLRILHKWLGLIVGLQILLWTVSGLVFSWLDQEDVAAEPNVQKAPRSVLRGGARVIEPGVLFGGSGGATIQDVTLMPLYGEWMYRVRLPHRVELRRADDGARFEITGPLIHGLALAHYAGDGALQTISRRASTLEARGAGAVWEAAFGDPQRTRLYFSAEDGRLVAARNGTWRVFDFFWMLHTMDYRGRDDFNHPLVILFSTGALWLGISGALLLYQSFRPARRAASGPRSRT